MQTEYTSNATDKWQYGLEELAQHLRRAQQRSRLRSLFADDRWMRMRVTSSAYVYSGFVQDVGVAWAALNEAENDTGNEHTNTLSDYVRLGLIESSVSSLSTRPINLVVNAVATGCWPLARALAVAARNPSLVERIVIYTGLLMCNKLDAAQQNQVQMLVRGAVLESANRIPMRFLVPLLPFLRGEFFEEIWTEIMRQFSVASVRPATRSWANIQFTEEDKEVYIDEAISLLENAPANKRAPIVNRVMEAILGCIRSISADSDKSTKEKRAPENLIAAVLDYTVDSLRSQAKDSNTLGRQLQRVAPYLRESESSDSLLLQIVEALESINSPVFHQLVIPAITPMLQEELLARVLNRTPATRAEQARPLASHGDVHGQSYSETLQQMFNADVDSLIKGADRLSLRLGPQRPSDKPESTTHGDLGLAAQKEEAVSRLVASVFPHLNLQQWRRTSDLPSEQEAMATDAQNLSTLAGPTLILTYAHGLSDIELCTVVERSLDRNNIALQIKMMDEVASRVSGILETDELLRNIRRVKGAIICGTLKLAHQQPAGFSEPWRSLPVDVLREADLSVVLDYILNLPVEVERNAFVWGMHGQVVDESRRCLLVETLEPILPYLDSLQLARAFAHVSGLTNVKVRESTLDVMAPYLTASQIATVAAQGIIRDETEQCRFLQSLSQLVSEDQREPLISWIITAALDIPKGETLSELLAGLLVEKDISQGPLLNRVLEHITRLPPNDRLDALTGLIGRLPDPIPRPLLDAVLELPSESDRGTFSWRGLAITALMDRFPGDVLSDVWDAIQELPGYLHVGSAEAFGWHWSYSYPYAAAVNALAPRATDELREKIFEVACCLPWKPREEILRRIAENATGDLAVKLLNHILETLHGYRSTELSPETIWRDEGAFYTGPIPMFRAEREVAAAEMIAALAPKVSTADLETVLKNLALFENSGPRSWLPGQLLPHVTDAQRLQILPAAMISALEFIVEDPSRFDLLTTLLPFFRNAVEEEIRPLRQLTQKYFPDRNEVFLSSKDLDVMSNEDYGRYEELTAKYFSPQIKQAMHNLVDSSSDEQKRHVMTQTILMPPFATHVDELALHALLRSPLDRRIEALPEIKKGLRSDQYDSLVSKTFSDLLLLRQEDVDQFTNSLIELLPHLPTELHSTVVELALSLEPSALLQEDELEAMFYGELLKEFPDRPSLFFDERSYGPLPAMLVQHDRDKKLKRLLTNLHGNREAILVALLPQLDPALASRLVDSVLRLPENQRIRAMFSLIPGLSDELKTKTYENILTMRSAFGRSWLLWHMSEYFSKEQCRAAIPVAVEAVKQLHTPAGRVVALFGLLSLTDEDEPRRQVLQWILETVEDIIDIGDRLHILSLFIEMARDQQDLLERTLESMLKLHNTEWRKQVLALFGKAAEIHGSLPEKLITRARSVLIEELNNSAKLERKSYLIGLKQLRPAIKSLNDPNDNYLITKATREICVDWQWL